MAGTLEYEELNKNLEMVDGHAVKAPEDYQNPEQLYQALIAGYVSIIRQRISQ